MLVVPASFSPLH